MPGSSLALPCRCERHGFPRILSHARPGPRAGRARRPRADLREPRRRWDARAVRSADGGAVGTYAVPKRQRADHAAACSRRRRYLRRPIESASATHGVRPELVRAVIQVESGFNPRAVAQGGDGPDAVDARDRGQLGVDNPWIPAENIRGGVAYLGSLIAIRQRGAGAGGLQRRPRRGEPLRAARAAVPRDAGLRAEDHP